MSGPAVNVVLRLDNSKVREDSEKARGILSTSIGPTVDVFNVADKAARLFGESLKAAGQGLVYMTERTGAVQSLSATLEDTQKALGEAADRSGVLGSGLGAIEDAVKDLATYFRSANGREAINGFFSVLATGAANAIDAVVGAKKAFRDFRFFLSEQGLGDEMVVPLDGGTPEEEAATALAGRLREAANKPVLDRGTYVDKEKNKQIRDDLSERERIYADGLRKIQQLQDGMQQQEDARTKAAAGRLALSASLADQETAIEKMKAETAEENAARRAEVEDKFAAKRQQDETARAAERNAQAKRQSSFELDLAMQGVNAISGALTAGAAAIANGGDIGAAIANAMGGAIAALGGTLIATGTGVLAGMALAGIVPGLAALFPPWGAPAAIGAIAAGTLLLGGGTYIQSLASGGGGGGGGGRGAPAPSGSGGRSAGGRSGLSGASSGFNAATSAPAPITNVYNYSFSGPIGGSPRRIARDLRDLTTVGDSLLTGRRQPGGR